MRADRIQFIDTGRSYGGAERVALALADAFRREGAAVRCLVHPEAGRFAAALREKGIDARPFGEASCVGAMTALASEIRSFRPALVHIHRTWPLSDRYAAAAAHYAGHARVVATEHVRFEECGFRDRLRKKALSAFDHRIVCVSEAVRQSLARFWKIAPRRLHVVPNGIDTERFARGGGEREGGGTGHFPPGCPFRIGAVGRLEEQKNFAALIDAMPAILEREPGARLVIAGEGSLADDLRARTALAGLSGSVTLAGSIPDVATFLAELDLFALPSLWEGLPLTILEAMAAGAPIVATDVDGTGEAIRHRREGLLVPPGDVAALADACVEVLHRREEALARARAATDRARHEYSRRAMVEGYRQVYES